MASATIAEADDCGCPDEELPHQNVLVLQGGGALGAYHLGVCEELASINLAADWVCGISIGAVNAALIAGNPPGKRLDAMLTFWERMSRGFDPGFAIPGGAARELWSEAMGLWIAVTGVPGFFAPRFPPAPLHPAGTVGAISFYDTGPLRRTLDELVDWDRLNDGPMRFSVGAVSVTTGRMHFFDNHGGPDHARICADHVLASGALPPGFPPVEIAGDWYWDGGIASNAPLQHVLDSSREQAMNIFQVDLFPAEGDFPVTLLDAETRAQDIRFASRTRLNTRVETDLAAARAVVRRVLDDCRPDLSGLSAAEVALLRGFACEQHIEIAQIIYRDKAYGGQARGFEFSRPTMEAHRAAGRRDAAKALNLRDWRQPPTVNGVRCHDAGLPTATPAARAQLPVARS